jgi:uncharacterized ubiquitin-like protein YukD
MSVRHYSELDIRLPSGETASVTVSYAYASESLQIRLPDGSEHSVKVADLAEVLNRFNLLRDKEINIPCSILPSYSSLED